MIHNKLLINKQEQVPKSNHFEYDKLLQQVNERKEPIIDIGIISSTINNMYTYLPKQDYNEYFEMIGSLIIHHNYIKNNTYISNPFKGTIMTKGIGILYVMTNLDPLLQQIIGQYIENNS